MASGHGRLTTHALDTMSGRPAAGLKIRLTRLDGGSGEVLAEARTNSDGRCDAPLLEGEALTKGSYELVFFVGDYFRDNGVALGEPAFLDQVPIRFGLEDPDSHYHVPLLLSPYGYSTYRGS